MCACCQHREEALRILALCPLHVCACFVCVSWPAYSACVCLIRGVCVYGGLDGQDLLCDVSIFFPRSGESKGGCDAWPLTGLPPQQAEEATGAQGGPVRKWGLSGEPPGLGRRAVCPSERSGG